LFRACFLPGAKELLFNEPNGMIQIMASPKTPEFPGFVFFLFGFLFFSPRIRAWFSAYRLISRIMAIPIKLSRNLD